MDHRSQVLGGIGKLAQCEDDQRKDLEYVVGRLDMYRTKVLLYCMMVLLARPTKVRR